MTTLKILKMEANDKTDSNNRFMIHNSTRINDCRIITLKRHHHANGNLTAVNNGVDLPFNIQRTFYIYDVPGGAERGGHSHYTCHEFIIAISGSFDVTIDDGHDRFTYTLNRPYQGLLVVPGIWRTLQNFSSGSVCLALASHHFDEEDYVREYETFCRLKQTDDGNQ